MSRWLAAGRRRLRARHAWRGSAIGALAGTLVGVAVIVVARLVFSVPGWALVGVAIGLPVVAAGLVAAGFAARWRVDAREVALVLDRVGETEERLITALHLAGSAPDDPRTRAVLAELDDVEIDSLAQRLPVRWPRAARWAPAVLAASLALTWLPAGRLADWLPEPTRTPLAQAGERLQERLSELDRPPEAPVLPEDLEREIAELAEDMRSDRLDGAEAAAELDQLAKQLAALQDSLAEAEDALDALEDAAEQLDRSAAQELAEALRRDDPAAAERAAQQLEESLSRADPETRQRTAEAMQRAGEQLSESGDPALQGAGEALREAASEARAGGRLSEQRKADLAEQLRQAREAGARMAEDREALERAQRLAGAVEGARQQLGGGDPAGRSSQQPGDGASGPSGGADGEGQGSRSESGEGSGSGEGGGVGAGDGVGASGHTWEDEGERSGGSAGAGGQEDRTSSRREGQHIDDFEKFYEAVRLEGATPLVAGTNAQLHEAGQVDELEYRLTTAEETASIGRVTLPDTYREAASAAIDAEPIPPAYRSAVRDYFGEME